MRASVARPTAAALDDLETALPERITSMSLRVWPQDFPEDIAVQRRMPYESRADSVMYCQVLAYLALSRGWSLYLYNPKDVENTAAREPADEVLHGPRATLGPPWSKDHRRARGDDPGRLTSPRGVLPRPPARQPYRRGVCLLTGRGPENVARN
ncbi:MAG TPA: hypothetical protein VGR26_04675 [Acidimicrobiales bacterium]|nr:hypothetical protein [Acidimicrobiales bacterium]